MAIAATLTLADYRRHAQHAIAVDASLPPGSTADAATNQIVNTAGRWMFKHKWRFRERPPAILPFKESIDFEDATWNEASKTITKTGAFEDYTFSIGDLVTIDEGSTGTVTGLYTVASRTSDNAITLSESILDPDSLETTLTIDGSIALPYVNLPSDFGELVSIHGQGTTIHVQLTTMDDVIERRAKNLTQTGMFYAAIVQPGQLDQDDALPAVRLELDRAPDSHDPDAIILNYYRGWTTLTADTHIPAIWGEAEDLLIEYVRAFAEGYMNRHADADGILPVTSMNDRLKDIEEGPIFQRTSDIVGLIQPSYGPIRNTASDMQRRIYTDIRTALGGAVQMTS